jgi:hypothetical protein
LLEKGDDGVDGLGTTDQRRSCEWPERRLPRRHLWRGASRGSLELRSLVRRQLQRHRQPRDRIGVRAAARAALKQTNRVRADPGTLREFFLSELGAVAKTPQQFGKWYRASAHRLALSSLVLSGSAESS